MAAIPFGFNIPSPVESKRLARRCMKIRFHFNVSTSYLSGSTVTIFVQLSKVSSLPFTFLTSLRNNTLLHTLKLIGLTSTQSCYGHLPAKHQRAAEPAQFQLWATVFLFQSEDTMLFSSDPLVAGLEEGVANWRELQRLKEFKSETTMKCPSSPKSLIPGPCHRSCEGPKVAL